MCLGSVKAGGNKHCNSTMCVPYTVTFSGFGFGVQYMTVCLGSVKAGGNKHCNRLQCNSYK